MPLFSLPSPYGIGSMGRAAYEYIDFLVAAGQKYWQLLPLGPTDLGDSPYSSPSSFAGNTNLIDLSGLAADGLITKEFLDSFSWGEDLEKINYELIKKNRAAVFKEAYRSFKQREAECGEGRQNAGNEEDNSSQTAEYAPASGAAREYNREGLRKFQEENSAWLNNYALFMALSEKFKTPWQDWPEEIRAREPEAVARYEAELSEIISLICFTQYLFFTQWNKLRTYAREKGIRLIGDMPVYAASNSADVWSEPEFFKLEDDVAGVPPDAFSEEGQLWGNPIYDYEAMERDGFGWWIRRVDAAGRLYDVLRIDHFRGFESYWAVPKTEKTAINGRWVKGPGMKLVGVLTGWFNEMEFIAEDLGQITPEVHKLLCDSGLPGMKVLEFAFDASGSSAYLPHSCGENSICYVGTHDNNTVLGWLKELSAEDKAFASDYMHITEDEGWAWGMIRTGMSTASRLFIAQMQDVLELPESARMNVPGVAAGNWCWRMKEGAATKDIAARLYKYTETYRRIEHEHTC